MLRDITLVIGLTASIAANAQEGIPFKCPVSGATMTNDQNATVTFTRREGLTCFFKRANNSEGAWMAGVALPTGNVVTRFKSDIEKIWPARVGAKTEWLQLEAWAYQFIVRERKMLTVPAGTFDVLVIDATEEGIRQNSHRSYRRYYYALDFGYLVKYEPILEKGSWGGTTPPQPWEAIKITIPNASVSAPVPAASIPATTPAPSATAQPATQTTAERLSRLKELFDQKLISQAEYEQKRKAIIDGL